MQENEAASEAARGQACGRAPGVKVGQPLHRALHAPVWLLQSLNSARHPRLPPGRVDLRPTVGPTSPSALAETGALVNSTLSVRTRMNRTWPIEQAGGSPVAMNRVMCDVTSRQGLAGRLPTLLQHRLGYQVMFKAREERG